MPARSLGQPSIEHNKIDKSNEIDESFLEDQDLVAALSNAERDAGLTPPEDLDDKANIPR